MQIGLADWEGAKKTCNRILSVLIQNAGFHFAVNFMLVFTETQQQLSLFVLPHIMIQMIKIRVLAAWNNFKG